MKDKFNHVRQVAPIYTCSVLFARWRQCAWQHSALSCAKMAESIDLLFGLWTQVGRRKHKFSGIRQVCQCALMGGHIGSTWRIRLNHPSTVVMWRYVKLLWPLVIFVTFCNANNVKQKFYKWYWNRRATQSVHCNALPWKPLQDHWLI